MAYHQGKDHCCNSGNLDEQHVHEEEWRAECNDNGRKTLECTDDDYYRNFGGCKGICDCIGGKLRPGECSSNGTEGWAAVVNALALAGIAVLSIIAATRLNSTHLAGGTGVPNFNNVVVGGTSAGAGSSTSGVPTMVVGQPVLGVVTVAAPGVSAENNGKSETL